MRLQLQKKYIELSDIISFNFMPLEEVRWQAGQYINITMPDVPPVDADRLFTIASAPHEALIKITTIPSESFYKKRMLKLQPGEVIEADQVGGDFVWQDDGRQKLYLAGGIGVTTFRSIILDRFHNKLPNKAVMLYAGKNERRPFTEELQLIAQQDSTLQIFDFVTTRLTIEELKKTVPDYAGRTIYLAGSQNFVEGLGEDLMHLGIPRSHIKYDWFDGYIDLEY